MCSRTPKAASGDEARCEDDLVSASHWPIRSATLSDRPRLRDIFRDAALSNEGDRESLEAHPEGLLLPDGPLDEGLVLVAADDADIPVGFATLLPSPAGFELEDLFVDPDRMRRGIATALIRESLALARREGARRIEVTGNVHALGFYESAGFVAELEVPTPYGAAAIRMHLDVPADG